MSAFNKRVLVVQPSMSGGTFQALYFDRLTNELYPDVCLIGTNGEYLFSTNSLRLKGADVEPGASIGIVWGDSQVFGAGRSGWPEAMNSWSRGCTFLNGGIEGVNHQVVLNRAQIFNLDFKQDYHICVNILVPGIHDVGSNATFSKDLMRAVDHLPNLILGTMPTSLNPNIVDRDLSPFMAQGVAGGDERYGFFGGDPYSVSRQRLIYSHLVERNSMIRAVAEERGIPLLDLFATFETKSIDDFRDNFCDITHPRPRAYPAFAAAAFTAVSELRSRTA